MRKIPEQYRNLPSAVELEQARANFKDAARTLSEANIAARATGRKLTSEMERAIEVLNVAANHLKQTEAEFNRETGGPESVPLTEPVVSKVRLLFSPEEQIEAIRLLEKECARNLPFMEETAEQGLDQVRLAAVKLSNGNLEELQRQVNVAKQDWREVICCAESPEAMRLGLNETSRLDEKTRRDLEARDRAQYLAWLRASSDE